MLASIGRGLKSGGGWRSRLAFLLGLVLVFTLTSGVVLIDRVQSAARQERNYFIAADEVEWNYAPGEVDLIKGEPFDDDAKVFLERGPDRIGRIYRKAVYREYTDATFATRKPIEPQWQHLGILGPVIRAEVGDTVRVVFRNNTQHPQSLHAHGVLYDKRSEGAPYNDGTGEEDKVDDEVEPGASHTYLWQVPERAGPGPHDPSSIVWMYHGHTEEAADTNAGLIGPIIVSARGTTKPDRTPQAVDREFVTLFTVFDENASPYLEHNIRTYAGNPGSVKKDDDDFVESNLKHGINGFLFGHVPGLTVRQGERVRWYVLSLGTEVDLHTPHWHGLTVLSMGMRTDNLELLPGSMKVADMVADNPGAWLYHCHVNDHITAGMQALFRITP
jgi:FtsP/CotA-like multicopper oxidase with cupredoxin domain